MTPNFERLMQIAADGVAGCHVPFGMNEWCGTVACAIGTHIIRHPEADIKLEKFAFSKNLMPAIESLISIEAVAAYCTISTPNALYLFGHESYPKEFWNDPHYVAARIRAWCLDHGYVAPVEQSFVQMKPSRQPTPCAV